MIKQTYEHLLERRKLVKRLKKAVNSKEEYDDLIKDEKEINEKLKKHMCVYYKYKKCNPIKCTVSGSNICGRRKK